MSRQAEYRLPNERVMFRLPTPQRSISRMKRLFKCAVGTDRIDMTRRAEWSRSIRASLAACLLLGLGACEVIENGAVGIEIPTDAIHVTVINDLGYPAQADLVFQRTSLEVRRTVLQLNAFGAHTSDELLPTVADALAVEARNREIGTPGYGSMIGRKVLQRGVEFTAGGELEILLSDLPPDQPPEEQNVPPVADAGSNQMVDAEATVTLDGSASFDSDGTLVSYAWTEIDGGTPVTLSDPSAIMPTFVAPTLEPEAIRILQFQLVVTDDDGAIGNDVVTIMVLGPDAPPTPLNVFVLSDPGATIAGGNVLLTAKIVGGTPPFSYSWSAWQPNGALGGGLSNGSQSPASWHAPNGPLGMWTFRVHVTDSIGGAGMAQGNVTLATDCNTDGMPDIVVSDELGEGDCNTNGTLDECDAADHSVDCDTNGIPDACVLAFHDCNTNLVFDACESLGEGNDCNTNGRPDVCDLDGHDCDTDGTLDDCHEFSDCNTNGTSDRCDLTTSHDCNTNHRLDACDIAYEQSSDCDTNGVPDECLPGVGVLGPIPYRSAADSPFASLGDELVIEDFEDGELDAPGIHVTSGMLLGPTGITDSVDGDDGNIDGSGTGGHSWFSISGTSGLTFCFDPKALGGYPGRAGVVWTDGDGTITFFAYDGNGELLGMLQGDHADGGSSGSTAEDRFYGAVSLNGISKISIFNSSGGIEVDHVQYSMASVAYTDCNTNGQLDLCEFPGGQPDCNTNGVPDVCDIGIAGLRNDYDCDTNGILDPCDIAAGAPDCNFNQFPDVCDLPYDDCNTDGTPDKCVPPGPDCDTNGYADLCELVEFDCNTNGLHDRCETCDCNSNQVPDACEPDCNTNGWADSCDVAFTKGECAVGLSGPTQPFRLNPNGVEDSARDHNVRIAADGAGCWIAVWESNDSLGGAIGTDYDILVSRSVDYGATWTGPVALNSRAAIDGAADDDINPVIVTDRLGTWIVVWGSYGTAGADYDVVYSRSTDGGQAWSPQALLDPTQSSDSAVDNVPQLAADSRGHWVASWASNRATDLDDVPDFDMYYAYSDDGGQSWSAAALLNSDGLLDGAFDSGPQLATDDQGTWIAVWNADAPAFGGTAGTDFEILYSRSTDNGVTWSPMLTLNANSASNDDDNGVQIAVDCSGAWVAVWVSRDSLGNFNLGNDRDIVCAIGTDRGSTWSAPRPVNSNAGGDSGDDYTPVIVADERGHFVVAWYSFDSLDGQIGGDADVLMAYTSDRGADWSSVAPLNLDAWSDVLQGDQFVALATDRQGHFVGAWTRMSTAQTPAFDDDIYEAQFWLPDCRYGTSTDFNENDIPDECEDLGGS